jgi:hypothetical protein
MRRLSYQGLILLAGCIVAACEGDNSLNPELPRRPPAVLGFVRVNGLARSGVSIKVLTRLRNFRVSTSADGRYSIPADSVSTAPGDTLVHLLLMGGLGAACYVPGPGVANAVEGATDTLSFDIGCPDSTTPNQIDGVVTSATIGPLAGVVVSLTIYGVDKGSVVTQENGRFAYPAVTWPGTGDGALVFTISEGLPATCAPPTLPSFALVRDGRVTPVIPVDCLGP